MTQTSQLDAHYAALQLANLRRKVVMSYQPTVDMLVAEFDEQYNGVPETSSEYVRAKQLRVEQLVRYRAAVVELSAALSALWAGCGKDPRDLPRGDDDVPPEYSRIRAAHEAYRRELAGEPIEDDVDAMVDQHYEALVDYASRDRGAE